MRMKIISVLGLTLLCCVFVESKDFVVGTRANNLLISTEKIVKRAIPLFRRDEDYTYTDTKDRVIKAIIARDLDRSEGEVTLTDGGVGKKTVTLHLQSAKGARLNYLILIFTNK